VPESVQAVVATLGIVNSDGKVTWIEQLLWRALESVIERVNALYSKTLVSL